MILFRYEVKHPPLDRASVRIVVGAVENHLKLVNRGQRGASSIVVADQVSQIAVEQPAGGDVPKNVLAAKLRHERAAINKTTADRVAIPMAIGCYWINGSHRR